MTNRKLMPLLLAALVGLGVAPACKEPDPKDPATWTARLGDADAKKVAEAVKELRNLKAKESVSAVAPLLKHGEVAVRLEAATTLGELGEAAAVRPLIDAIDLTATSKQAEQLNVKIANALGALKDKSATTVLSRLAGAPQDVVRLAAVQALGELRDPASIPVLVGFIEDEKAPPLITKFAIVALGDMKADAAVPALLKALVVERKGISFYVETSYALLQVGPGAIAPLTALIDGSAKEYYAWAAAKNRAPAGYLSKAAVVLADIGAQSAIPALVKLMNWNDPAGEEAYQLIVRGQAAEALGRLRAKEGAAAIAAQVNITEANVRGQYAHALAQIGDRAQAAKLEAAAKNPKDTWGARSEAIIGLALLSDGKSKATLEAIAKAEGAEEAVKHCLAEESTENEARKAQRCEQERTLRPQLLSDALAALAAADECKESIDCWIAKSKDKAARVRERAAYTLGRLQDPKAVEALVAAARDNDLDVRRAAYVGLDWSLQTPASRAALVASRDGLDKQLKEEAGKAFTSRVNEDLKRVVWKLKQL